MPSMKSLRILAPKSGAGSMSPAGISSTACTASVVTFTRPRGYFDAQRDKLSFDGQTPPPGVPPAGAGVSSSKIKVNESGLRVIKAEFNGEHLAGRTWPASENRVVVLELTY